MSSPQGFRARIGYPNVPNCRALSSPPAPPKVSTIGPNATSARPAPSITVTHPAHSAFGTARVGRDHRIHACARPDVDNSLPGAGQAPMERVGHPSERGDRRLRKPLEPLVPVAGIRRRAKPGVEMERGVRMLD